MPYATNPRDGRRMYFEDDGGDRAAVVFHGGLLDSVELVRDSHIARALPRDEFRLVYADHRGVGRSDKPQDPEAYAMPLRVADAVAVLESAESSALTSSAPPTEAGSATGSASTRPNARSRS